jgi:hypothetical protein
MDQRTQELSDRVHAQLEKQETRIGHLVSRRKYGTKTNCLGVDQLLHTCQHLFGSRIPGWQHKTRISRENMPTTVGSRTKRGFDIAGS